MLHTSRTLTALAVLAVATTGCAASAVAASDAAPGRAAGGPPGAAAPAAPQPARNVVDIVVTDHSLDLPETIASGWTTFRLHNRSDETHFGLIDLLPEGITVQDSIDEVVPAFQQGMDLIAAGEDPGPAFAELPDWFANVVYHGGPGLVGPGETAVTTLYLEPGTYMMECYVKTDGVFHTTHGMVAGFTVVDEESQRREPTADVEVTVAADGEDAGFTIDGEFRPGRQTIAVHFAGQTVHGNALGHDLHVARIEDDTDLDELATWVNWITGLDGAAPAQFLGGTQDMPAGSTAYVDVTLRPGTYALIAEVDDPASKGMLEVITVTAP